MDDLKIAYFFCSFGCVLIWFGEQAKKKSRKDLVLGSAHCDPVNGKHGRE